MHAFVLFLSLASCTGEPLPQDVTPWEAGGVACPVDVPAPPVVSAAEWSPTDPPLGGDIIVFGSTPLAPDLVYAGSGQNGVYRSLDQGFTWESLVITDPAGQEIGVNVGHVYGQFSVAQEDASCMAFMSNQPMITADGGETLHAVSLDVAPTVQGVTFLGRRLLLITGEGVVYAADDCGTAAEQIGAIAGIPAPVPATHNHGQIASKFWMESNRDAVFAMTDAGALYTSVDQGVGWSKQFEDTAWNNVTFRVDRSTQWIVRQGSGSYEVQQRVGGGDPSIGFSTVATVSGTASGAFLGPDGEYLVSGSGGMWSSVQGEIAVGVEDEGRGIFAVGRVGSSLLAGYRAGVAVSPDDGASWGWTSEEMTDLDIVNLHIHPACPNVLFAGTQCRSGTYRSEDWGQSWARVAADMHYTMGVDVAPTDPQEVWGVTDDQLYMSNDMGMTWQNRYPKGTGVSGAHYHGLGVSPDRSSTVLVGSVGSGEYADDTARVYRTDNHGATWSSSSTGLPASTESFHTIHFADTVPGAVLLGTYRAGLGISHGGTTPGIGVFRSTDSGLSWSQLTGTDALSFSHFAECDGRIYAATDAGVIATDDLGETWTTLLAPAADSEMLNVACAGSRLLAVDPALGVFRSADGGATWEDWTGSVVFDLQAWESQLGLELSPDGTLAYFTHPGLGVLMRGWE